MKKSAFQLAAGEAAPDAASEELIWLLGQPHLQNYLDFVRDKVVGGAAISPRLLADEWRAANDHYYTLEQEEAGLADGADCLPLDPCFAPLARSLARNRFFRRTFDTLPTQIRMVELSRLIVSQSTVSAAFGAGLRAQLCDAPSPETLFRFALPTDRPQPSVKVRKAGKSRWIFTSDSTDFRLHSPALLDPSQVAGLDTFGPVAAIVALMPGFSSNFLSVIRSDERLLLDNGYHRAFAMLSAGITHAPAVVQTVTRKDELHIVGNEDVSADPAFYFRAARPPLLKDFLDPMLGKRLRAHRMQTTIEIDVTTRTSTGAIV
jgi:hypothetical protein